MKAQQNSWNALLFCRKKLRRGIFMVTGAHVHGTRLGGALADRICCEAPRWAQRFVPDFVLAPVHRQGRRYLANRLRYGFDVKWKHRGRAVHAVLRQRHGIKAGTVRMQTTGGTMRLLDGAHENTTLHDAIEFPATNTC